MYRQKKQENNHTQNYCLRFYRKFFGSHTYNSNKSNDEKQSHTLKINVNTNKKRETHTQSECEMYTKNVTLLISHMTALGFSLDVSNERLWIMIVSFMFILLSK